MRNSGNGPSENNRYTDIISASGNGFDPVHWLKTPCRAAIEGFGPSANVAASFSRLVRPQISSSHTLLSQISAAARPSQPEDHLAEIESPQQPSRLEAARSLACDPARLRATVRQSIADQ
jgi:hypothetical protein